ncbi:MAG: NAD-dependent epimerase/dehydratase family protein [bacterium]|nr:NAD-dependent epimerase/dehydratase family protein [bacterium]
MSKHPWEGTEVLISGGAGFVGGNLVRMLLASGHRMKITVVDNLLSAEKNNIPADRRVHLLHGSIAANRILAQITDRFQYIFHLATFHGNQNSICDPLADHENNTLTTLKLMNHLKGFRQVRKLVYSSAGCASAVKTFGTPKSTREDAPISLVQDSPYSISKIIGEFYAMYFYRQYGLSAVRARFQNVYGPGEILGAGKWRGTAATVWRNVIPVFIYKALNRLPLPVENKGVATRDFIYVEDICRGLMACALKGRPGEAYNLASGKQTKILDLALAINELTGNAAGLKLLPRRSWDNSGKRFGDTRKARAEIDFRAAVGLREGLQETIAWTRENLPVINKCINKHGKHMGL